MRKIGLVPDWKKAWKWMSVNCMVYAGAINATWISVPEDMRDKVPPQVVGGLTIGLLILGVVGRVLRKK